MSAGASVDRLARPRHRPRRDEGVGGVGAVAAGVHPRRAADRRRGSCAGRSRSIPASAARRATCASSAAAPATTRSPSTRMPLNAAPEPDHHAGDAAVAHDQVRADPHREAPAPPPAAPRRKPARSASSAGWNSQSAGPPTRSQVSSAIGRSAVSVPAHRAARHRHQPRRPVAAPSGVTGRQPRASGKDVATSLITYASALLRTIAHASRARARCDPVSRPSRVDRLLVVVARRSAAPAARSPRR